MYCKLCQRYINGVKAKIRHQIKDKCPGLKHVFDAKDVEYERPTPEFRRGWRTK